MERALPAASGSRIPHHRTHATRLLHRLNRCPGEAPNATGYARMEEGQLPAVQMSTHAIKTELQELLGRVRPDKNWPKRVSVTHLCQYAIHNIAADSTDNDSRRALQLAQVLYDHERR